MSRDPQSDADCLESLPVQLSDLLREQIGSRYAAGDKLPSLRALRDEYGVSINTVSAAIDILAGDGLVTRRQSSGIYVAARRRRIGILSELDLLDGRISPYFRAVANALREQLLAQGAAPRLYVGHSNPAFLQDEFTCPEFWQDAAAGQLDGAIITNAPSSVAWAERVRALPFPVVGHHTGYQVDLDHAGIANLAVDRLSRAGCKRLALLNWQEPEPFRQALRDHGLEIRDAWVRVDLHPACPGAGWDAFRELWFSHQQKPDGLLITDDVLYADAQLAIMELGIAVPEQLRIAMLTSRGCSPLIRLPALVLEMNPADVADQFIGLMMQRLKGGEVAPQRRLVAFHE